MILDKFLYGEDDIQNTTSLMNLSQVLRDIGDYKSAKESYEKASEI